MFEDGCPGVPGLRVPAPARPRLEVPLEVAGPRRAAGQQGELCGEVAGAAEVQCQEQCGLISCLYMQLCMDIEYIKKSKVFS